MESTRLSLLARAGAGSESDWSRLIALYRPLVYGWLRRHEVSHHDAEELTQDVLSVLVEKLSTFSHSGRTGAFRHWLREITVNRARGFWRVGRNRTKAITVSNLVLMVDQLADETSDLSKRWEREHDQHVLRELLQRMESQFTEQTLTAFRRQVFDGAGADDVASDLKMTVGAVYSAKSRVLRELRREASGLVDEVVFL